MVDSIYLTIATKSNLIVETSEREGETKVGQQIQLLSSVDPGRFQDSLSESFKSGARYAIIGIPEDIGPRANYGRAGAEKSWNAFLQYFLNMQCNRFLDASQFLLVGQIDLAEIKRRESQMASVDGKASAKDLRDLCGEIDGRVFPVLQHIAAAGLEPIVIAGGNNNSYPTIKGVVTALRAKYKDANLTMGTVNCDPHADFRLIEGRHSGNPFSYADKEGFLDSYCVLGAHENYNSEDMLNRMAQRSYPLYFFEQMVRGEETWEEQVQHVIDYLSKSSGFTGVELDLDGIKHMPASAKTPFGITEEQAFYFVYQVASAVDTKYLHLSEAAPAYGEDGVRSVGKVMAKMVVEYVRGREQYRVRRPQLAALRTSRF